MTPDRRLHAYRPDLADARLGGQVEAARFVEGRAAVVTSAVCAFRQAPEARAEVAATKLMGEPLLVFEEAGDWVWAQSQEDGYVGYASRAEIAFDPPAAPGLRVAALQAHLYAEPDLKTPPIGWAPLTARLAAGPGPERNRFRPLADGAWIYAAHVAEAADGPPGWAGDWVAVAEAFRQTPYLWGGESADGLDCSGLVHVALAACGLAAPRDSDMQARELGEALAPGAELRRGDLVFWKGHVGVMLDPTRLLHANAWSMSTIEEPLATARARIAEQGGGAPTVQKRLAPETLPRLNR